MKIFIILILLYNLSFSINWETDSNEIQFTTKNINSNYSKNNITINMFKVDLNKYEIKISDVYRSAKEINSYDYSLETVAKAHNSIFIINGGYNKSFINPVPAGLVKIDNKIYSNLNLNYKDPQSGILCINDNNISFIKRKNYEKSNNKNKLCNSALQAGPRLLEDKGSIGINSSQIKKRYERSLICINDPNNIIFIQTSKASLYELAELFGLNINNTLIKCNTLLNLDGDESSGAILKNNKNYFKYGTTHSLIATAIFIKLKKKINSQD